MRASLVSKLVLGLYLFAAHTLGAVPTNETPDAYSEERRHLIAEDLPLTETEAARFWPLYERYQAELSQLLQRRRRYIEEYGSYYEEMTDEVAKKLIVESLDLEEDLLRLWRQYLPVFEKVLPAKKLARYYQIEGKIRAAVNAEIAERLPLMK